jgi:hypothetical protein
MLIITTQLITLIRPSTDENIHKTNTDKNGIYQNNNVSLTLMKLSRLTLHRTAFSIMTLSKRKFDCSSSSAVKLCHSGECRGAPNFCSHKNNFQTVAILFFGQKSQHCHHRCLPNVAQGKYHKTFYDRILLIFVIS